MHAERMVVIVVVHCKLSTMTLNQAAAATAPGSASFTWGRTEVIEYLYLDSLPLITTKQGRFNVFLHDLKTSSGSNLSKQLTVF